MDNFYVFGLVLCSAAAVALLFFQRYIKSDPLWVLRISVGVGLIAFWSLNVVQTNKREAQLAKRQHEITQIQTRLDKIKLRQAELKSRSDALASEDAKLPLDPVVQNSLSGQRLAVVRESAAIKAELDDIQKELNANRN